MICQPIHTDTRHVAVERVLLAAARARRPLVRGATRPPPASHPLIPPPCVYTPCRCSTSRSCPAYTPILTRLILLSPLQVQHVHQILPALRALRANQSLARSLARNARRFAHSTLRFERVLGYFRALLEALAARQQQSVALTSGFKSVRSREDLMLFLGLCDCDAPGAQCGRHATCCNGYNCPTRGLGC